MHLPYRDNTDTENIKCHKKADKSIITEYIALHLNSN